MSLYDYSDQAEDIYNTPDPTVIRAGSEIKARIITVREGTSEKNDCDWFMPAFEALDHPTAKEFNDFFWHLDASKLSAKELFRSKNKLKNFAAAFGLDLTRPFELEDLIGLEGWLIVGTSNDEVYGEQNTVRKYVAPRR